MPKSFFKSAWCSQGVEQIDWQKLPTEKSSAKAFWGTSYPKCWARKTQPNEEKTWVWVWAEKVQKMLCPNCTKAGGTVWRFAVSPNFNYKIREFSRTIFRWLERSFNLVIFDGQNDDLRLEHQHLRSVDSGSTDRCDDPSRNGTFHGMADGLRVTPHPPKRI